MNRPYPLELPTWLLIVGVYGGWLALTGYAGSLPGWLLPLLGAPLLCLHGSLQHELIHGHPTRSARLNAALAWPPLALWLPFALYRDSHSEHHRTDALTSPQTDPESWYVLPPVWQGYRPWQRALLLANNTLLGRVLLGPWLAALRLWHSEYARLRAGDRRYLGVWLVHLAGVGLVLAWVMTVGGLTLGQYVLYIVWPGVALGLVRSYYEHRPAACQNERSVLIDAGWFWRLLFLNNNYHAVHHAEPALPWYALPARYRAQRADLLARNGGYYFAGYGEVLRRYAVQPKDLPCWPGPQGAACASTTPGIGAVGPGNASLSASTPVCG